MPRDSKKLTPKQELFALEYQKDLNATQAAIRAGYSSRTARSQGQRLLTNVAIKQHISTGMIERCERTKIDADWLLLRLQYELEADIADLFYESGAMKPPGEWPLIWRQGLISGFDVKQEVTHENGQRVPSGLSISVRLSDRVKRLEMLGRHVDVQAFKDKMELDTNAHLEATLNQALKRVSDYRANSGER